MTHPARERYYIVQYIDTKGSTKQKSLKTLDKNIARERANGFIQTLIIEEQVEIRMQQERDKEKQYRKTSRPIKPRKCIEIGGYKVNITSSLIDTYRTFYKSKSIVKSTIQDYKRLERLLEEYSIEWVDFNENLFSLFIDKLQKRFLSIDKKRYTDTFYNYARDIRTFLNYCVDSGILMTEIINPLKQRLPKKQKSKNQGHSRTIPNSILKDIVMTFIEKGDLEVALFIYLLYMTTCRINEIAPLKKKDFNSAHGILDIRQPKTNNYKRLDNLTEPVKKVLDHLSQNKEENDYLFEGHKDHRYYSKRWRTLMEEKGWIEEQEGRTHCRYELRCTRHTSATTVLNAFNSDFLRNALGHKRQSENATAYVGKIEKKHSKKSNATPPMYKGGSCYGECTIQGNQHIVLVALDLALDVDTFILENIESSEQT